MHFLTFTSIPGHMPIAIRRQLTAGSVIASSTRPTHKVIFSPLSHCKPIILHGSRLKPPRRAAMLGHPTADLRRLPRDLVDALEPDVDLAEGVLVRIFGTVDVGDVGLDVAGLDEVGGLRSWRG